MAAISESQPYQGQHPLYPVRPPDTGRLQEEVQEGKEWMRRERLDECGRRGWVSVVGEAR